MNTGNDRIETHRDLIRGGLIALAVPVLIVAGWALIAPHNWYSTFPGGGRHWVSALGPYDEHLVRDFAATYLGIGLLTLAAAVLLTRQLVAAALATSLVFQVPHFIFHIANKDQLSTGDYLVNIGLLGVGLALTVYLLVLVLRPRERTVAHRTQLEGDVSYGTR
jgi:hypothetical protein